MGQINELTKTAHQNSVSKGFWDSQNTDNVNIVLAKLALIHSELSEATEAVRHGDFDNLQEELADTVIRVMDLAGAYMMNLEEAIIDKMEKNKKRPRMHGKLA